MSIDVGDLRLRVETDFDNATLQRIVDSAEKAVARAAGSATSEVETIEAFGARFLVLSRRVSAFVSITERLRFSSDAVTLSANDYRQSGDYKLLRLADGDNSSSFWGSEVVVTYTPEVDTEVRDEAALKLCYLSIEYRAYESEKSGDWQGKQKEYNAARRAVLKEVREGRSPIV